MTCRPGHECDEGHPQRDIEVCDGIHCYRPCDIIAYEECVARDAERRLPHDPGDEDRRPVEIDEHYEWTADHREGQWAPWTYHRDARGHMRDEPR